MRERERTTRTLTIPEVNDRLPGLLDEVSREETRIVVEERGVPVAALISATDLERLVRLDRERAERFAAIDRLREAFKDMPPEEIEREADRAVAELRDEAATATA